MKNVLVLCTANSARSILAEALLAKLGRGRIKAYSAGSTPRGAVNPDAVALLAELGHDTSNLRSKSWDEFAGPDAPQMDIVITVCDNAAGESCPLWPGAPLKAHWGIPDPANAEGGEAERRAAFQRAYDLLEARIGALCTLELENADRRALQAELDRIGAMEGATAMARDKAKQG